MKKRLLSVLLCAGMAVSMLAAVVPEIQILHLMQEQIQSRAVRAKAIRHMSRIRGRL